MFVILILLSFVLFVMFQLEWVESKEGFDTDLPICKNSVGSYASSVPSCYPTVQKDDYLSYPHDFMSDYILKSKIVTPVCPLDPYDQVGSILDASFNNWNLNLFNSNASTFNASTFNASTSNASTSNDSTSNGSGSNANGPVPSNQLGGSSDPSISLPSTPMFTDNSLSTPQKPVDPKPACKEDKTSSPDVCPPCPACDRCPEPTVDCKKVIHYKDQQYPVPVIDDFSKFSRF